MWDLCRNEWPGITINKDSLNNIQEYTITGSLVDITKLKLYLQEVEHSLQKAGNDHKKRTKRLRKDNLHHSLYNKEAFRYIKNKQMTPMYALKRGDGTLSTNPHELDGMVRQAWSGVYSGNATNPFQLVSDYLVKYSQYIFKLAPHNIADITMDVKHVAKEYGVSAPGLDAMHPVDIKIDGDIPMAWMASTLNLNESGASWPKSTLHAAGHMLSKPGGNQQVPLDYRILHIN